ncbi:hypothetical protein HPP92_026911 [Vanilla planifolia]|uniref:Uncharacterized protein n=1 Tax=Vanilla planifolia TaxID=51239 RepID=A0A835PCW5_VANPL|nr:hypothetical protein HPP92_027065 [Vanilla planifolia]KAG0450132.1 hypothetical protein HPP92_026911 [Vanilla planifolia]
MRGSKARYALTSMLDILRQDGHPLGVFGAQIGVLKEADHIGLRGLLEREDRVALETEIRREGLRNLTNSLLNGSLRTRRSSLF